MIERVALLRRTPLRYTRVPESSGGASIRMSALGLGVPDRPIIPFIEGDGVGKDITPATRAVLDAAVRVCYGTSRELVWYEVFAGEKSLALSGEPLPTSTLDAFRTHLVGLRGPLAAPGRGALVSLSIALRQVLDLYVSHRPIRHLPGIPAPYPRRTSPITLFRENTEDVYGAIEFAAGVPATCSLLGVLQDLYPVHHDRIRFADECALAIKTASREGTRRLTAAAVWHALETQAPSLTLVSKSSVLPLVDGAFVGWAYEVATTEFRLDVVTEREVKILSAAVGVFEPKLGPDASGSRWAKAAASSATSSSSPFTPLPTSPPASPTDTPSPSSSPTSHPSDPTDPSDALFAKIAEAAFGEYGTLSFSRQAAVRKEVALVLQTIGSTHGEGRWRTKLLIRDRECDEAVQDLMLRPHSYGVVATQNMYGDILSDLLAAQVGGSAMIPSASINAETGVALFEAAHGPALESALLNVFNPCSLILSGEMMLRYLGWTEAADVILRAVDTTVGEGSVTRDIHEQLKGADRERATCLSCSDFAQRVIEKIEQAV